MYNNVDFSKRNGRERWEIMKIFIAPGVDGIVLRILTENADYLHEPSEYFCKESVNPRGCDGS
jgi:hypothetical protein